MKLKTLFIAIGLLSIGSSCSKEECPSSSSSTGIVGEWKLIEELMDPGDGSGTFQPVSSNKIITFLGDGTFEANGGMCYMENQANTSSTGTYDVTTEMFAPGDCINLPPMPIEYQYSVSGNTLILTYPCIEGCKQKYSRL